MAIPRMMETASASVSGLSLGGKDTLRD